MTEDSQSEPNYHSLLAYQWQQPVGELVKCFFMDSLLGCAGCHPRGGTIGGVANDVTGNRMNIPIPDLHGAALHYPRIAGPGFIATIGTLHHGLVWFYQN